MKVQINDDFDLNIIINSGQCFRPYEMENGAYHFTTGEHSLLIAKDSSDASQKTYDVSCSEAEWENVWKKYFDLETNYSLIRASITDSDSYMKKASEIGCGIRILQQDKFEMLISFIISQRKSIPAIRSSVEKLCEKYGTKLDDGYLFPTPAQLVLATDEELKACGLGYRVSYVMDAADAINSGRLDLKALEELDDENLFEALKTIRGVGDKVANCVMLFAYHRVGRAPVDTWIKKVIEEVYDGKNVFEEYGNVGGIMQQYVFYAAQHEKVLG